VRQDAPSARKTTVGKDTVRIDARQRVTGTAAYTGDVSLPGMLYARVLRSPHPHARIRRIDTSKALALAGVKAIITHENCKTGWTSGGQPGGNIYGPGPATRFLFNNPVRFWGDAVAAVAAVDRYTAEDALQLIEVEYETLPFVLDPEDALRPGAPEIYPGGNLSPNVRNVKEPESYKRGNVDEALKASDRVFEARYSTSYINNAQMERRVSLAAWEGDRLTLYASTQGISNCQAHMAKDLAIKPENVRVICQFMGGGFGNKNQNHDFDLMAAVLAKTAAAPVKLEFTRKEDYTAVHGRWPTRQYYKVGVTKDGVLHAIQLRGVSGMGPYRKGSGGMYGVELYQCPNVETVISPAYTNMGVSANMRGPSYPQGVFGIESMMDDVAYKLKMDPLEFRLKNMTRKWRDETPYTVASLQDCLAQGAEKFEWKKRWHAPGADTGPTKRGIGVAIGSIQSALGRSGARIELNAAGTYTVFVAVTDIGAGAKTTMAMIAAEALGVPLSKIAIVSGDTDTCPFSVGESGSRNTTQTGTAVIAAAQDLRKQIAEKGAPKGGDVLKASAITTPTVNGVVRATFIAHFAEVEVDTEIGRVRVIRYLASQDNGRIINPLTAASQVKGAVAMGVGMALHEHLLYDPRSGIPLNAGYYGARVLTHMDAPDVEVHFIETDDGYGAYGAKCLGESGIIPSVAAVANAIFNATGRRITDLPITRDKILGVPA
jgi:xanthine dehydrogenase molybdenum-binding subunit